MNKESDHLEQIQQIRALMERSSRFISLSGLSGVFAGVFALIGAVAAYFYLGNQINMTSYFDYPVNSSVAPNKEVLSFFVIDALLVLGASLTSGLLLTWRSAKKKGQTIWDATAKRLLINLMIPLAAGGLFCLILLMHSLIGLVAPCTLIFYGLALINGSKYTLDDIRYLGICEIILGLLAAFFIGYGLLFWAIGFGVLHIVYGLLMYNKYER
jgi:predicted lysophospholipase L1 biosynthesis ABC-type transport system permease subunit